MAAQKITPSLWQNTAPGIGNYGAIEEGGYLVGGTPTPGTAVSRALSGGDSYADTSPDIYIYNPGTSGCSLYMDFIKYVVAQAPTSAVSVQYAFTLDTVARALTTDNTTAATMVNPNGNMPPIVAPIVKYQSSATASVIAASSAAARIVGRGSLGGLPIVGDEHIIAFGQTMAGSPGMTAVEGAGQPGSHIHGVAGVIIAPGQSLTMYLWAVSNVTNELKYELQVGFYAR